VGSPETKRATLFGEYSDDFKLRRVRNRQRENIKKAQNIEPERETRNAGRNTLRGGLRGPGRTKMKIAAKGEAENP